MPGNKAQRRIPGPSGNGASPNGQSRSNPASPTDKGLEFLHKSSVSWGPSLKARLLIALGDNQDGMTEGALHQALQGQIPEDCATPGSNGRRRLVQKALQELASERRIRREGNRDEDLVRPVPPRPDDRFVIDPFFRDEVPPLSPEERAGLEWKLLVEGCRDPLVVWKHHGRTFLADGHTRLAICLRHGLTYTLVEIELPDRATVQDWLWQQHEGRRNMSRAAQRYARARRYNAAKASHGGNRRNGRSSGQTGHLMPASAKVAADCKVGRRSLSRDGRFAAALDRITNVCGRDFFARVLGGSLKLGQDDIEILAGKREVEMKSLVADLLAGKEVCLRPDAKKGRLVLSGSTVEEWVKVLVKKLGPDEARDFSAILGKQLGEADG